MSVSEKNRKWALFLKIIFFSPARGTGTERRPKAGAEWRCPAPEKKKRTKFSKRKAHFCFFGDRHKKTKESVFFLFKAKISKKKEKKTNTISCSENTFWKNKTRKLDCKTTQWERWKVIRENELWPHCLKTNQGRNYNFQPTQRSLEQKLFGKQQ